MRRARSGPSAWRWRRRGSRTSLLAWGRWRRRRPARWTEGRGSPMRTRSLRLRGSARGGSPRLHGRGGHEPSHAGASVRRKRRVEGVGGLPLIRHPCPLNALALGPFDLLIPAHEVGIPALRRLALRRVIRHSGRLVPARKGTGGCDRCGPREMLRRVSDPR